MTRQYNPDQPPERQQQDWTCSVRTATWLLKSLGYAVEAGDMQEWMQAAGLVSPALGLHDGSGAALARWLTDTFGVEAYARYPVDLCDVLATAGDQPIGLGSGGYYHWMAVRRENWDGTLQLMNPAPHWRDVGEVLTAEKWAAGAPWAAVWLEAVPRQGAETMERVQELETALSEMQRVAREIVLPNLDKALAVPGLPQAAREALEFGARPAVQTIMRGGGSEAPA